MNRSKLSFWLLLFVETLISVGLVYWLVGGSWWLALFLGAAIANIAELYRRIVWNRHLFMIADAELVRVSALANSLEEEADDLKTQLEEIKGRLEVLESR